MSLKSRIDAAEKQTEPCDFVIGWMEHESGPYTLNGKSYATCEEAEAAIKGRRVLWVGWAD